MVCRTFKGTKVYFNKWVYPTRLGKSTIKPQSEFSMNLRNIITGVGPVVLTKGIVTEIIVTSDILVLNEIGPLDFHKTLHFGIIIWNKQTKKVNILPVNGIYLFYS